MIFKKIISNNFIEICSLFGLNSSKKYIININDSIQTTFTDWVTVGNNLPEKNNKTSKIKNRLFLTFKKK